MAVREVFNLYLQRSCIEIYIWTILRKANLNKILKKTKFGQQLFQTLKASMAMAWVPVWFNDGFVAWLDYQQPDNRETEQSNALV